MPPLTTRSNSASQYRRASGVTSESSLARQRRDPRQRRRLRLETAASATPPRRAPGSAAPAAPRPETAAGPSRDPAGTRIRSSMTCATASTRRPSCADRRPAPAARGRRSPRDRGGRFENASARVPVAASSATTNWRRGSVPCDRRRRNRTPPSRSAGTRDRAPRRRPSSTTRWRRCGRATTRVPRCRCPGSVARGTVWNSQTWRPVRASNARTSPAGPIAGKLRRARSGNHEVSENRRRGAKTQIGGELNLPVRAELRFRSAGQRIERDQPSIEGACENATIASTFPVRHPSMPRASVPARELRVERPPFGAALGIQRDDASAR